MSEEKTTEILDDRRLKIEELGIYELRGVARTLGVVSPTTKKRDFLISEILERIGNDDIGVCQKTSKGRPFKKIEGLENILSFIGGNLPNEDEKIEYSDLLMFAQEIPVFNQISNEEQRVQGVLRYFKEKSYFIDLESNYIVFVEEDLIKKYKLENGDFIFGGAKQINIDQQFLLSNILTINGIDEKKRVLISFDEREKIIPSNFEKIADKEVLVGGRNILLIDDPLFLSQKEFKVIQDGSSLFDKIIILGVNQCEEDKMLVDSIKGNKYTFISEKGKRGVNKDFNCIVDSINLCERLSSQGFNVLFVVCDLMNVINSLDNYFAKGEVFKEHLKQTEIIVEKMITLPCLYSNGKNCSEILVCNDLDLTDSFLKNNIVKVSKRIK